MASISDDGNGLKRILFVDSSGNRRAVRLGKLSVKQAERIKPRIEFLITASLGGGMDDETTRWVAALPDKLHRRLAAVGLVQAREMSDGSLGAFIDRYIAGRPEAKPATVIVWKRSKKNLVKHFGQARAMRSVSAADAEAYRAFLFAEGLATNTVRRQCGIAKQFWHAAIRNGLASQNPFTGIPCTVGSNEKRRFYIDAKLAQAVLDACPNDRWRLLFSLARFAGLRVPSETANLQWSDINWERNRFWVRSPKTEHHEGGGGRFVPIVPEIRSLLLSMFEAAEPGATHVFPLQRTDSNVGPQFLRILKRGGIEPWPKLFVNLRASAASDLVQRHGVSAATAWLGHSIGVAHKHYWQVRDEDFDRASGAETAQIQKAAQNAAQQPPAQAGTEQKLVGAGAQKTPGFPGDSASCQPVPNVLMGVKGLEPLTSRV